VSQLSEHGGPAFPSATAQQRREQETPGKRLANIDHIAVVVDDIAKAAEWYTNQFECELEWCDDTWAFLAFANCGLALVRAEQHPPHVAIQATNLAQYGPATSHRDGTKSVYISDIDGNAVEMLYRPRKRVQ
jgi:catechol-2,3-dioxygenase